jgi:hypothetical protein
MSNDWMPKKEAELVELMATWEEMLANAGNRTDYGWTVQDCTNTQVVMDKFITAREEYKHVKTPEKRIDKDEAKVNAVAGMRKFAIDNIRNNDLMPDSAKFHMGVRIPDKTHTPQPKPHSLVAFELATRPGSHSVVADFWIDGRATKGKGDYHAAEGRYWVRPIGAPPPKDPDEDGWHSVASTRRPWTRRIGGDYAGQVFYMTMRWENKATGKDGGEGGKGDWSAIQSIILQ